MTHCIIQNARNRVPFTPPNYVELKKWFFVIPRRQSRNGVTRNHFVETKLQVVTYWTTTKHDWNNFHIVWTLSVKTLSNIAFARFACALSPSQDSSVVLQPVIPAINIEETAFVLLLCDGSHHLDCKYRESSSQATDSGRTPQLFPKTVIRKDESIY